MTTNTAIPSATAAIKFVVGRSYYGRSICDSSCVYTMRVLRRTAKTIHVRMQDGVLKTLRPRLYNATETVQPNGNYSMALTISADREQPMQVQPHGHIYNDPTCACAHCVAKRTEPTGDDQRRKLDADILLTVSRDSLTYLIAAQTVRGAVNTKLALQAAGFTVTTRIWNGKAYSEERI